MTNYSQYKHEHEEDIDLSIEDIKMYRADRFVDSDTGQTYYMHEGDEPSHGTSSKALVLKGALIIVIFGLIGGAWIFGLNRSNFFDVDDNQGQTLDQVTNNIQNNFEEFTQVLQDLEPTLDPELLEQEGDLVDSLVQELGGNTENNDINFGLEGEELLQGLEIQEAN